MNLPKEFEQKMKLLLGEEYPLYEESFSKPFHGGIRANTLKIDAKELPSLVPSVIKKIPWTTNGYYYNIQEQPAKHPYYHAGLYYIQEPSAMTPATLLPVEPGDKVLDVCAAPGGKSTHLGAKLQGEGVLVSNDISNSRAKALLKNIELFGIKNSIVVSEDPHKLATTFPEYFDKILIDAPCSGEGMFRKDPAVMKAWEKNGVPFYNELQKDIVVEAVKMLKPGGYMLYSTCTFSAEENEGTIKYLLETCEEMELMPIDKCEGFADGRPELVDGPKELSYCVRIWPFKVEGEGHFVALLRKKEAPITSIIKYQGDSKVKLSEDAVKFFKDCSLTFDETRFELQDERLFYRPEDIPSLKGLRILRSGLFLGEMKKNRFEPSQALALALKSTEYKHIINLSCDDERVIKYLKCETIEIEEDRPNGWYLICVDGYPLGWAKLNGTTLKNKYLAFWRWM